KRGSETVLVVEDEADVRQFAVDMLRELGYDVVEAGDGAAGLAVLDSRPDIKLLFTDVGLPGGFNGRQLADEAARRRPTIKILYMTGDARNAIVHQGRLDSGVALISKPFTYNELAARVRAVLDET
ncbi:MAG: response regulator, partial [Stellaceae bacterium]